MITLPNSPCFGITKRSELIPLSGFPDNGIIGNAPPKDDSEKKKSMLDKLNCYKAEAERNAVPVDGGEPPQDTPAAERTR
jgi:hypothetical protein